jgi:hypothetical protein
VRPIECLCYEILRELEPDIEFECLQESCGRYRIEKRKREKEMDAIQVNIHGIKCDAIGCDYEDPTVPYEDYKQWVNKPCPKCGANLLTEQDYATTRFLAELVSAANKVIPPAPEEEERVKMVFGLNGTGDIKIQVEEEKK